MTAVPHLFARVLLESGGATQLGVAADHLPPKWFTKDPRTSFREEIGALLDVVRAACSAAASAGAQTSLFDLWLSVYASVAGWAAAAGHPPLLAAFGPSLVERAAIDAFCRLHGTTFGEAVRSGALGVRLGAVHPELEGTQPGEWLPDAPLRTIVARHAVGLSDPLTLSDLGPGERLKDGLPQTLEECLAEYGLTHLKIKLCGDADRDLARLARIAELVRRAGRPCAATLDGNEQYADVEAFRAFWERLDASGCPFSRPPRLIFVEQPLHRDTSLTDAARRSLQDWSDRPPMIIDESDGELHSLRRALDCGYVGTSHKNCKGVFKGIANRCLISRRLAERGDERLTMSGEDLSNVGPVALLQDLAVHATLGIEHVERNGHHYFRGLAMLPADVQEAVLEHHADLYARHPEGFPAVRVVDGAMRIESVVEAPFGVVPLLDTSRFTPADTWRADSLGD